MDKKLKTVDILKETKTVSEDVKLKMKESASIKRKIKASLQSGSKTIPEITDDTKLDSSTVTYSVMTMFKFGDIIVDKIDDDDEYYYYNLKGKK